MQPANRLRLVREYYFSQKLREVKQLIADGRPIINLGIGNPDLAPPPVAIDALRHHALDSSVHGYMPYRGLPALREAIAQHYFDKFRVKLSVEKEVLPLLGSKEGIMHVSMAYLDPGDAVLIPELSYPTYESVTRLLQAEVIRYPLMEESNWEPDWDFFRNLDWSRIKIFWINYPHMPTGSAGSGSLFEEAYRIAQENKVLLINDNPYSFLGGGDPLSALSNERQGVLELNSMSKTFNMAGWRIGWACGDSQVIENMVKVKSNMDSGMFQPIQMAAIKALEMPEEWYANIKEIYESRRSVTKRLADALDMQYADDQEGMFLWGRIFSDAEKRVDELLYEKSIFVAPGSIFGDKGRGYLRISLCNSEEKINEAASRLR